jgi:hypothetical protein
LSFAFLLREKQYLQKLQFFIHLSLLFVICGLVEMLWASFLHQGCRNPVSGLAGRTVLAEAALNVFVIVEKRK